MLRQSPGQFVLGTLYLAFAGAAWGASSPTVLKEIRFWSSSDVTRIALELSQDVEFKQGQIENPLRIFLDLVDVKPSPGFRGIAYTVPVEDGLVKQIRVAPNQSRVTRVVLDMDADAEVIASKLVNPYRILLDVRRRGGGGGKSKPAVEPQAPSAVTSSQQPPQSQQQLSRNQPKAFVAPPPRTAQMPSKTVIPDLAGIPAPSAVRLPLPKFPSSMVVSRPAPLVASKVTAAAPPASQSQQQQPAQVSSRAALPAKPAETPRLTDPTWTRVLGLKLNRVVLDAGHGGHDQGTESRGGLLEKDIVLDVTLRLGRLLEDRMGTEVIYTRKDDTFVPLESRPELANRVKADLFLSIHANSSPARTASGVETYYLHLTNSRDDLAVATRENASSEKSVHELTELVNKIVSFDKRDESREFASRIQNATHELSVQTNGRLRNRGVKRAPFVVLIGTKMPSVLAEIGFISNPKEESLLRKAEHRQKVAEALFKGIVQYARSLSHFSMARAAGADE